jgi:hypothetical protein
VAARAEAFDREGSPASLLTDRRARLALAVTAYLIVGGVLAGFLGTWTDEEYTLATTAHGFEYAIRHAAGFERQAPLYFALLAVWRSVPHLLDSVWFARMFSVLCGAGTLVAFAAAGRRIAPRTDPLWFALLAGLNPFAVWAALEIRHYALALLLSVLLWLAFDSGFLSGSRPNARIAFVALAVAGIDVQYFIAFAPVGYAVTLLVLGRFRALGWLVGCGAIVLLAVAPLAASAGGQGNWFVAEAPSLEQIVRWTLVHPWLEFVFPYDWRQWDENVMSRRAYTLAVALFVLFAAWCRPAITRRTVALLAGAATIELLYVLLAIALRIQLSDRYFIALYAPVALVAYSVWRELGEGRRPEGRGIFGATAVLTVAVLVSHYRFLAQPGDWRRVAAYLERHARASDTIAVYQPDAMTPLLRQYHGDVPVVPYPHAVSQDSYTIAAVSVTSLAQARTALDALGSHRRIWFVEDGSCKAEAPQFGCDYVERAIASEFRIVSSATFYGSRVDELIRPGTLGAHAASERAAQAQAQRRGHVVVARDEHAR